jgi:hypothetical protein
LSPVGLLFALLARLKDVPRPGLLALGLFLRRRAAGSPEQE